MPRGLLLIDVDGPLNPYAARRTGPAVGLPPLPVIEFPDLVPGAGWVTGWKWLAIADYAEGRPLAWFDDQHDLAGHAELRARRGTTPTLLCHVDPRDGLGAEHFDQVRTWALD